MRRPVGGGREVPVQTPDNTAPPVVNANVLVEAISVGSTSVANVRDTTFQQYVVDDRSGWVGA
jgi:hypothetical protein